MQLRLSLLRKYIPLAFLRFPLVKKNERTRNTFLFTSIPLHLFIVSVPISFPRYGDGKMCKKKDELPLDSRGKRQAHHSFLPSPDSFFWHHPSGMHGGFAKACCCLIPTVAFPVACKSVFPLSPNWKSFPKFTAVVSVKPLGCCYQASVKSWFL